jgi:hypothetical protein
MQPRYTAVTNFVVFQAAWFGCVWAAAHGRAPLALLIAAVAVAIHLILSRDRLAELPVLLAATALGYLWDSAVTATGFITYPTDGGPSVWAPAWIAAMWALFATTLNTSLAWLRSRLVTATLLGAVGGPLAFLAAERLSALELTKPMAALALQGLGWSVLLPGLLWFAGRLRAQPLRDESPILARAPQRSVATGMAALLVTTLAAVTPGFAEARVLEFDVSLDQRPIGRHTYSFERQADRLQVESVADFEVKALVFTAWSYRHRNVETWDADCLAAIESSTIINGERTTVAGDGGPAGLRVATPQRETPLAGCVRSFAYWDPELLESGRLLNPQTGEYLPVVRRALPRGELQIGGHSVPVERYALTGADLDITLTYHAETGEWLALDSIVEGGRRLSYRRSLDRTVRAD